MPICLPRWNKFRECSSHGGEENRFAMSNYTECYACTQVGVPAFHSSRCDSNHQQPHLEAAAGSSLMPIGTRPEPDTSWGRANGKKKKKKKKSGFGFGFGQVLDPRSRYMQRWNRAVLLARATALAVDPLFFYVVTLSGNGFPCFYMDRVLAVVITVVRTCVDLVHVCHLWLQFRLAYVSSESLVIGCGKLVWDPRAIAMHNLRSLNKFWLDAFVILPIPQVMIWFVVPKLLEEERIKPTMTILLVAYLLQSLPNFYHSIYLMKRLKKVTGYIFGSIWWRFNLNVLAYLIVSHEFKSSLFALTWIVSKVAGGCWYVLAMRRLVTCIQQQCDRRMNCNLPLSCSKGNNPSGVNLTSIESYCLEVDGSFNYGIYTPALLIFASNSLPVKILYPIFWGLLNLSSFGNELVPTSHWLEVLFSICITLGGLALFVTLIGNIQICLHAVMASKKRMQIRHRDLEWWMKRRQLPSHLRQRVRNFERQKWISMEGQDEMQLIQDLPDGLRKDIKRYLCIDIIRKVPLFQMLDDIILDNICDMVRPLVYSQGEKIIREGDCVQRMVFILHGRVQRSQGLSKGFVATSVLEPGSFFGDELLLWCLRLPSSDRLPSSSAAFSCIDPLEAYGLDAYHLRYITCHFRYKFNQWSLKQLIRYYSSNWRTWGAVVIQLAWRRYRMRKGEITHAMQNGGNENPQLKKFVSMFLSLRPNDHLE